MPSAYVDKAFDQVSVAVPPLIAALLLGISYPRR